MTDMHDAARWRIAEKVFIESPLFRGEVIIEDIEEDRFTTTYHMISANPPPSMYDYRYIPQNDTGA